VQATGLDLSPAALNFSRGRGHARLVAADLTALPFRDATFDVVTALDVIEHIADDAAALGEIARVLRPGGILVATVPAYRFLWGPHDVALHHRRRYRGGEFRARVARAGLVVERQTYLLAALFPLAAAMRLARRGQAVPEGGSQALLPRVPAWLNRALIRFQAMELAVARRISLPFGLTILTVGRKGEVHRR
jgi:SAM-dependent methyltransferase